MDDSKVAGKSGVGCTHVVEPEKKKGAASLAVKYSGIKIVNGTSLILVLFGCFVQFLTAKTKSHERHTVE